jgi:hypothetical protein
MTLQGFAGSRSSRHRSSCVVIQWFAALIGQLGRCFGYLDAHFKHGFAARGQITAATPSR